MLLLLLLQLFSSCQENSIAPPLSSAPLLLEDVEEPKLSLKEQNALAEFERWLDAEFYAAGPPGLSLAIVKGEQSVFRKTLGVLDVETQDTVNAQSVFRLASVSKGFAPVLTGILVQEGCLNWDDLISGYLPDFALKEKEATQSLTIRHVLSHSTGLPRHTYSNLLNMNVPYEEIVPMLKNVDIAHPVGTWYNYQNVAYSLIGDVIKQATGLSYGEALAEKVFEKLGMQQASTTYGAIAGCSNIAMPHGPDQAGHHRIAFKDKFYSVAPAAGVNASLEDMERWLSLLMGYQNDIIDSTYLQTLFQPHVEVAPREGVMRSWRPMDVSAYGLGWRLVEKEGKHYVFHGGFVNGYRSEIGFCQESGIGMVLLTNGSSHFMKDALPYFFDLLEHQGA